MCCVGVKDAACLKWTCIKETTSQTPQKSTSMNVIQELGGHTLVSWAATSDSCRFNCVCCLDGDICHKGSIIIYRRYTYSIDTHSTHQLSLSLSLSLSLTHARTHAHTHTHTQNTPSRAHTHVLCKPGRSSLLLMIIASLHYSHESLGLCDYLLTTLFNWKAQNVWPFNHKDCSPESMCVVIYLPDVSPENLGVFDHLALLIRRFT